jgi:glutathione peroxidase-family protein
LYEINYFYFSLKNNYLYDKKVYIINFDTYPSSIDLFIDLKIDINKNNVIFLNLRNVNEHKLKDINFNFSKYILIDREDNCYYYKKIK